MEEKNWHGPAKICHHLQYFPLFNVDDDNFLCVEDGRDMEHEPIGCDGHLLLGQHLVVPDPDGGAW